MIAATLERDPSVGDAARRLKVSPSAIRKWIALGVLKCYRTRPGGHRRIPEESIRELERRQEEDRDE